MSWYIIYLIIGIIIYFYFKNQKLKNKYADLLYKTKSEEIDRLLEELKLKGNKLPVLDFYEKFFELYFYCYLITKNKYSKSQDTYVYDIAHAHLFYYNLIIDKKFLITGFKLAGEFPLHGRPQKPQLPEHEFKYLRELEIFIEIAIDESLRICSSKKAAKDFYSLIHL